MQGNRKERNDMVASAIRHKSITILLVITIIMAGIYSLNKIPKDEFPQVSIPVGLIVGIYPGASEQEVEQQLTKPLEKFLWTFKEVNKKRTVTMSFNDGCAAIVTVQGDVTDEKKAEFWNNLKERLSLLKVTLPPGVLKLVAEDDFAEASTMLLTIESEEKTYRELNDYANALSDRLRNIDALANITTMGGQKEQIGIYLDRDRLSMYGINTALLMQKLSGLTGTVYTGSVSDGHLSRTLHVQSSLNTENDIAQTIISSSPSGDVVRLGDIATIKREQPAPRRYIRNNGKKCLLLSLQMYAGSNILDFGDEVKKTIDDFQATLPADVKLNLISDQSHVVGHAVKEFLVELSIAIISVIIIVMLMLPMRVAAVAVSTIPITIFASIALLQLFNLEINTVTLAALIVSLGMIVDDSVVVVDCYLDKLDEGMSRWKAAIESSYEFLKSIITATIVITFTFFPQLITTSEIMRDFVKWFPYSITIVLVVSLVVAIFVVPLMQYMMIGQGLRQMEAEHPSRRFKMLEKAQGAYERFITICFRHKWTTMATGTALIILGGVLLKSIPQRLTPRAERNQFTVDIHLPAGTDLKYTAQIADSLAGIMMKDERVVNLTVFYGSGSPRFHRMFVPNLGGSHFAQFIVNTHSDDETQGMIDDYSSKYSTYFSDAQILFRQLEYTDRSYPIEVRVTGDNLDSLHVATDSIWNRLARNKNIGVLNTSWGAINNRLEVIMHPEEANRLGLSKTLLSLNFALRYGGGIPVTSIWEGDHEISVVIRDANENQETIDNLKNIRVSGPIPTLTATPLSQVADVKPGWGDGCITHRNGIRTASVFGMLTRGALVGPLTKEVYKDLETLRLPEGITISKGGMADMDNQYRPQIYLGVLISILMIFFVIVFHLKSIMLTILVMSSLLFSLLGGALGLFFSGDEFGATAILGFVTLIGIIIRCSIIMVDYAEELFRKGQLSPVEAGLLAAKRRFRPVFLTSAAASMGVITMVLKDSPLWHPMGMVVFVGAFVSMLFVLTLIPVGYSLIRNKFLAVIFCCLLAYPANGQRVMNLKECIAAARVGNTSAKDAHNDLLTAKEQQKYARSKYFPTLGASATHFQSSDHLVKAQLFSEDMRAALQEIDDLIKMDFVGDLNFIKSGTLLGLTALEPVYTGGRLASYNKLADLQVDAREKLISVTDDQIVQTTQFLYYKIVELHELDKTFESIEKELKSIHQDAVNIYENGIVNKNDVLSVELMQDQMSALRIKTANACRLLRRALAKYMGMANEDIDVDTQIDTDISDPETLRVNPQEATLNRTETHLLDIWVQKSQLESKIAKASMLPIVLVGGQLSYNKLLSNWQHKAIAFATLQVPISAFWSERHEYKRKKIEEQKALDFRQDKRELITLQIMDAWDNLESTYKQTQIAEKSIVRAEENLRIQREYYRNGLTNMTILLDAQRQQQTALTQRTTAISEYLQAKTKYLILTGRRNY